MSHITTDRKASRRPTHRSAKGWLGLDRLEPRLLLSGGIPFLPDLIAWESEEKGYIHGWVIDENEQPGSKLLRLTTVAANIGAGPLEIRGGTVHPDQTQDVLQRIYNDDGSFQDRTAGTFEYHESHGHTHLEAFALYNLRAIATDGGVGTIVAAGEKTSFCLIDSDSYNANIPAAPPSAQYFSCGPELQGISVGWGDVYGRNLPDQWIDITGVPDGAYWLEVVIDPDNHLLESDETNNSTMIQVMIPDDHGNNASSATTAPTNEAVRGVVESGNDVDWFTFHGVMGYRYIIETSLTSLPDSVLRLFDPDGTTQLIVDDDSGVGRASKIEFEAPVDGDYFAQVSPFDTGMIGIYNLTVTEIVRPHIDISFDLSTTRETGPSGIIFTLSLDNPADHDLDLLFAVSGTATSGVDYLPLNGSVMVPAGMTSTTITVVPIDDDLVEDPETLTIQLLAGVGYQLGTNTLAMGVIGDGRVIEFTGGNPANFTGASGFMGSLILHGLGMGTVEFASDGPIDPLIVTLSGTTRASSLRFDSGGMDALATVGGVIVNGSLNRLDFREVDLLGNIRITGVLRVGRFRDLAGDHLLLIEGAGATKHDATTLIFRNVNDASVVSAIRIRKLLANRWAETDGVPNTITAPRIGSMAVTRHPQTNEPAVFQAGLNLGGAGSRSFTLGRAVIRGDLGSSDPSNPVRWNIVGKVGRITVGTIRHAEIEVAGSLEGVTLRPNSGNPAATFVNSSIIATRWTGPAKLGIVQTNNDRDGINEIEDDFGLRGRRFRRVVYTNPLGQKVVWNPLAPHHPPPPPPDNDFLIQLI